MVASPRTLPLLIAAVAAIALVVAMLIDDGIERLENVEGHAFQRGHQQHRIAVLKNRMPVGRRSQRPA
jgi:hypothetical protein